MLFQYRHKPFVAEIKTLLYSATQNHWFSYVLPKIFSKPKTGFWHCVESKAGVPFILVLLVFKGFCPSCPQNSVQDAECLGFYHVVKARRFWQCLRKSCLPQSGRKSVGVWQASSGECKWVKEENVARLVIVECGMRLPWKRNGYVKIKSVSDLSAWVLLLLLLSIFLSVCRNFWVISLQKC